MTKNMHTLQSEPYVFDDSPAAHETITDRLDKSLELIRNNADAEVAEEIVSHLIGYVDGYLNAATGDMLVQFMIERPVITHDREGKLETVCFLGIYAANREEEPMATDRTYEAALLKTVALVLDPDTRRIVGQMKTELDDNGGTRVYH